MKTPNGSARTLLCEKPECKLTSPPPCYTPGMFKQFMLKKLVQSQLGKVPPEHRALIEKLVDEKPELLVKLAEEAQAATKSGKSPEEAMQEIAKKYEGELKGLLGGN